MAAKKKKKTAKKAAGTRASPKASQGARKGSRKAVPRVGKQRAVASKKVSKVRKKTAAKKAGRPPVKSDALVSFVLEGIMGGDTVEKACEATKKICRRTWFRWLSEDADLQQRYVTAMEIRTLLLMDECIQIADDVKEDKQAIGKARLRVTTRQWTGERMARKVYGKNQDKKSNENVDLADRLQKAIDRVSK